MNSFYTSLENKIQRVHNRLAPVAAKIENQKYMSSLKNGLNDLTFLLLAGSFFLVLWIILQYISPTSLRLQNVLEMPIFLTYGMISFYAAISISYRHAKRIEAPVVPSIFGSVVITGIATGGGNMATFEVNQFGSKGLLISMIASFVTVELIKKVYRQKWRKKCEHIPGGSIQTLQLFMPVVLLSFILLLVNEWILHHTDQANVSDLIFSFILQGIHFLDSPLIVFTIVFLEMLLWYIGINGYAVLAGFVLPLATFYLSENVKSLMNGREAEYIFTPNFWDYFASLSGSGLVGALVILALLSRVKRLRNIGKTALIPSVFNISEPILYGMPICFNIYFFVPFVIGTPLLATFQWYVFKWGFVNVPVVHMADAPLPVAQYVSTMDWRALILLVVVFILAIAMYYPFFRMYEKSILEQQNQQQDDDQYAKLDLDF
ncbi:PTS sugar transporter subunit IIC [Bacillaceae bacterium SIJ1]|uniref:PTS sugar transporter subunit IIC n=1 Tax=Litoribacterium kuwaitense TaxID=1398745 RepID=UPI0013EB9279|nr:PTS transporter subunit EIIC [Litoribacterium kuwaitense]NGP46192.1 PTS sugar transporter subunit IIC [Litoribacterium kuwaitense]